MEEATRLVVGPDGQVTLPEALLSALALRPGDALTVSPVEGGLLVRPASSEGDIRAYGLAAAMWREVGGSTGFLRETEASWRV
jgi:bifunctional DNA-binding transcriptional regulator/antitoxin component of YhaV-PrlF toxin-antitoxin module